MAEAVAEQAAEGAETAPATLVDHFRRQVAERGASPALYFHASGRYRGISWSDFGRASLRLAAYLVSEGVAEGDGIAIWSNNRPEWHIADVAILSLRCRPVPVYQTLSAEEAAYVLQHSAARVVIAESRQVLDKVLSVRDGPPKLRRIVLIDDADSASSDVMVLSWQAALARGDEAQPQYGTEVDRRSRAVTLDDVATLIYTSGTTGPPKAVLLTHGNIAAAVAALDEFVVTTSDDRVLSYLPLAHIAERLATEFRSYVYGHPVWFLDGMHHLPERLREVRPTLFFGVPRVWEKMASRIREGIDALPPPRRWVARWAVRSSLRRVRDDARQRRPASRIAERLVLRRLRVQLGFDAARILVSGAAPIDPEVLRFFRAIGLEVLEVYGQTEDTGLTTMNRPGRSRIGTVGTPVRGNDVRIAEDGEILVRGPVVFPGYFHDDGATRETLADGWLHTGDIGEVEPDGYLRITDRKKDLIITAGGKNISPSHIEGLLQQHPLVSHAVAIGDKRPYVAALLTLDPDELQTFVNAHGMSGGIAGAAGSEAVRDALTAHVQTVNAQLAQVEQVKRWSVLPNDFEVGAELTPTLKMKRKVVAERHADAIEALYSR
ncbi:MAG: long-chain fatty acid--CoA ligase [Candidatus Dormibacteraeota bacterium]|nr:long-chain fatty acid--CoA ligase [Candidatus Dormibacteraeota bacterium]